MRRRREAALRVAGREAEVVRFPTTQACHITAVLLGGAQSLQTSTDDGCQGEVGCAVSSVPGHNGGALRVALDLYLDLPGQTWSCGRSVSYEW